MNTVPIDLAPLQLNKEGSRAIAIHPALAPSPARSQPHHAHSCPAPRHMMPHTAATRVPRTPLIGSLPDPSSSFLNSPMPPLSLPPPQRLDSREPTRQPATVVQFASSCPAEMGFLNNRNAQQRSFDDTSDLSRSPSLALMRSIDSMRRERLSDHRLSLERLSLNEQDEYEHNDDDETSEKGDTADDDLFVFEDQ
ncbi:hypothetical protein LEN26_018672 [Aphanomyces euteiches]|nr:hypothetical protein LEN26_018672 [Aphanomyces euteiches]KAH9128595.1 hypothetical protein AeMF1_001271 [Aphanomyces euteiches]KAH9193256.1 hypothetical protein AeNC1_004765 [Aphanomyces euteiches]